MMSRLPEGRREVYPSKRAAGRRQAPSFGPRLNISVAISVGLPLIVVGLFMGITGATRDVLLLLVLGAIVFIAGVLLFASGKRL
jgi:hypothetical protein